MAYSSRVGVQKHKDKDSACVTVFKNGDCIYRYNFTHDRQAGIYQSKWCYSLKEDEPAKEEISQGRQSTDDTMSPAAFISHTFEIHDLFPTALAEELTIIGYQLAKSFAGDA